MEHAEALALAQGLIEKLAPACVRIEVAGSLRREKPVVKDIEIVAEPRLEHPEDLFGRPDEPKPYDLDNRIAALVFDGTWDWDRVVKRNGPAYKRFILREGVAVDLFLAHSDNYGDTLAIRTGNAGFSRALVTQRYKGGLMPYGLEHRDGHLWRESTLIPCATEETFFDALDIPWIDPRVRTEETVAVLVKQIREKQHVRSNG